MPNQSSFPGTTASCSATSSTLTCSSAGLFEELNRGITSQRAQAKKTPSRWMKERFIWISLDWMLRYARASQKCCSGCHKNDGFEASTVRLVLRERENR